MSASTYTEHWESISATAGLLTHDREDIKLTMGRLAYHSVWCALEHTNVKSTRCTVVIVNQRDRTAD